MFTKVLVLAFVAVASCEDHGYRVKGVNNEPVQQYKYYYKHVPVTVQTEQGSAHEQYSPQSHGHTYTLQSIIHHTGHSGYQGSQNDNNEHVAPVYQYVQEEEQAPVHHEIPANHYQSIQYTTPAPVHYEQSEQAPQPHANNQQFVHEHHVQPHVAHGHEEPSYGHGAQQHEAPIYHSLHAEKLAHDSHDELIDYYAYPKYQYEYKVEDPHSGDSKFQHEYRDGDVVKGVYGVQESDGSFRIVEYNSDKESGFNAIVKHTAPGQHVQIETHHEN